MKIRSITSFFNPGVKTLEEYLEPLARFTQELKSRFEASGYEVQFSRLATPPFHTYLSDSLKTQITKIQKMESLIQDFGWSYLAVGPATPDKPESYAVIPALLGATQNVFCSGIIADKKQVYPDAVFACARIISESSTITPNGFANLRFAALANVPAFTPFFPSAYSLNEDQTSFSLAIECADEAIKSFSNADSLVGARESLISTLEKNAACLMEICAEISPKYEMIFRGFDFSPAPFPEDWCSLGKAFESLGLDHLGGPGSLAAAAFIADTLDRGQWQRAGFNGLMMPVMEDSILAARAAENVLSVKDLLLYSAVCGTGLDTIPLPGDTSTDALAGLLLDIGALATRLGKPLTGRLMPIPGKKAGDQTDFDFGYTVNSRIMSLDSQILRSPLAASAPISLNPRKPSL